ncbi:putative ABC-class ATPase [Methanofollis sp. W23]|uniref:P-loop domain-containing protein n=1 Tax=Methanofollis sp. W23 TaxID=2817849 RepID=UPI001D7694FA|nr:P-loop domain-containing protein [Methanofollis sp. W23]MBP2146420.1 putative ABC-class ATPase [Methanofollis sp. W23]
MMSRDGWMAATGKVVSVAGGAVDLPRVREGTNTFVIRSPDGGALQFSMPLLIPAPLPAEIDRHGADGATWAIIEAVKRRVPDEPHLRPLGGLDTPRPRRYAAWTEPVTILHSESAMGSGLWKADHENVLAEDGFHCTVKGAVPYPGGPEPRTVRHLGEEVAALADGVLATARQVPGSTLKDAALWSLDQKALRARLPAMGLVAFLGDGTMPARTYTPFRQHYRIAGPKDGVHIPFQCPETLEPVEVELPASGRVVTGLGIRRREALVISGSNAQGKTTLIQAIRAGEDDHAPGDGRELAVTVRGARTAEAGGLDLHGADVSLFFHRLPPGMTGTTKAAFGQGSGSMTMAMQFAAAIREEAPLIVVDEDRAAANLLVASCLQEEDVTPLARILAGDREVLGDATLVIASSSLDPLIAQADRILVLRGHQAGAVSKSAFRRAYLEHLEGLMRQVEGEG